MIARVVMLAAAAAAWFLFSVWASAVAIRSLPPTSAERQACMRAVGDADECRAILARRVWSDSLARVEQ